MKGASRPSVKAAGKPSVKAASKPVKATGRPPVKAADKRSADSRHAAEAAQSATQAKPAGAGLRSVAEKRQPPLAQTHLEAVREYLLDIDENEIPLNVWLAVRWLIDNKQEKLLYTLFEDEKLNEDAHEMLEFLLEKQGYRLAFSYESKGEKGEGKAGKGSATRRDAVIIPFGIVFATAVMEEDLARLPKMLPKTVKQITDRRLIRRACDVNDAPTILIDSHLYHLDHPEWQQESAVQTYLKGFFKYLGGQSGAIIPLSRDYQKRAEIERIGKVEEEMASPPVCFVLRAICAVVVINNDNNESVDFEARLFDHQLGEDSEDELDTEDNANISIDNNQQQQAWDELEELIAAELANAGVESLFGAYVYPQAVELWDVPNIGMMMYRRIPLQIALEEAMEKLLLKETEGEEISPLLYVSHHGDQQAIEEIRLAGYTNSNSPSFFNYVLPIDPAVDTPEDVSEMIIDLANEMQAEIVAIDGLLSNDRCPDCGEPTFYGPGDRIVHAHENEFLN